MALNLGRHRWQGTSPGSPGQYCGEAAAERPEDRRRPMRSSQHLWRILPGKTYVPPTVTVPTNEDCLCSKRDIGRGPVCNEPRLTLADYSKVPSVSPQDDSLQSHSRRYAIFRI